MKAFCSWIILAFLSVGELSAQSDFSIWAKQSDGETTFFPWFIISDETLPFVIDTRYNFDEPNTFGFFVGVPVGNGKVSHSISLGGMAGDYSAISLQLYTFVNEGRSSVFMSNQYSRGVGGDYHFGFHFIDALVRVNPWLHVGADETLYYDTSSKRLAINFGPAVKLSSGSFYVKIWRSWNLKGDPASVYFGLGSSSH